MTRFAEEQTFSPAILVVSFGLMLLVGIAMIAIPQPGLGKGEQLPPEVALFLAPALVTGLVGAFTLVFRLRTRIEGERLVFGFPLGLRRSIPLKSIASASPVTYRPIRDFGGWGLRFGTMGMMYNARGNKAVRLELTGGKIVFVGSQRREELANAIAAPRSSPTTAARQV